MESTIPGDPIGYLIIAVWNFTPKGNEPDMGKNIGIN